MPAEIMLPPFLKEKLEQAPHRHVVHKALENFSDWFRSSRLPFFPDYTDHGIQHIEQVLATAANLIPDQARLYFSGADAVALILAVLLHDSALHLTEAGVWQLLKDPAAPYQPIAPFDQKGWAQTWDDFMFLARRWDDTKLAQVFGSTEPGGLPTAAVRDPFAHWQNLTRTDHLLIGEFIRQQHPRLAHEMALHGVPGTAGALLKLDDSLPAEWRDLVGLIARSHGLPLRTCLDYLKTSPDFGEYARREYQGVHAVYLMALLRVADYVQIQGDRTSDRVFSYKKIYSSISTIEHKVHQAVRSITNTTDDPEALAIQARPEEVSVFLRLKEWLAGIQQELDGSWAVLGEVYGRHEQLRHLGLTFRRVLSNLDNVAEFAKTVPYVPDRIRFDVARAELLKLLIGPLYGDDPSYGVRELMQNAIDAVREYDQFVQEHHSFASVPRRAQEADVHIELSKFDDEAGYASMVIVDKGIGMQEEIIRDYFLKAGASYRRSPQWKTTFESDSTEGAKSKVVRSGRFGVGALAAFLIGSEIEVETKHIAANSGFRFKATIDREYIELQRVDAIAVGTSIYVKVDKKNYSALIKANNKISRPAFFNWFIFDKPTVSRVIDGVYPYYSNAIGLQHLPLDGKPTEWRRLAGDYPYQVYWAYTKSPMLVCNGFFVSNSESLKKGAVKIHKNEYFKHPFDLPNISIIDPDGLFPLSIKRDGVREGEYPFESDLVCDVLSELIAWVFFQGPSTPELPVSTTVDINDSRDYFGEIGFVMKASGYAIRLCNLLDRHPIDVFIVQPYSEIRTKVNFPSNKELLVFTDFFNAKDEGRLLTSIRSKNGKKQSASHVRQILYEYGYHVGDSGSLEEFSNERPSNKKKLYVAAEHGSFIEATTRKCPSSNALIGNWPKNLDYDYIGEGDDTLAFEERFFPDDCYIKVDSKPWILDDLWKKYFGDNWLPYDIEKRLAAFPDSAKELAEKYPQVVPDVFWNHLNIDKPLTTIVLPSYDSLEVDESPF